MLTIDHSPIFELKHVTKSYGNNMAVKDGNLRIYPGEVHALMGGNGAGKSTMIKIIAGAHQADSGEILLEGKSVAFKHPKEAMDSGIQVVYQELSLLPHLTVSENIAMPLSDKAYMIGKNQMPWPKKRSAGSARQLPISVRTISFRNSDRTRCRWSK